MVLVALAALNLGAMRAVSGFRGFTRSLLTTGVLPMANVLIAGLLIGRRYPGSRRFVLGFEAFGVMALAVAIAGVSMFPNVLTFRYLHLVLIPYRDYFGPRLTPATVPASFAIGFFAITFSMLNCLS
jgi:hypothetical protein